MFGFVARVVRIPSLAPKLPTRAAVGKTVPGFLNFLDFTHPK